ncbi:MAG TPA: tetratricopeptide repeat protein [Afipia sp.]
MLRKAIAINTQSDKTFYNYGLVLKALGKPEEALAAFNKSLALNPGAAESWNNLGTVYNDMRQYREAIASFDKAISLWPGYAEAFYNKGRSHSFVGEPESALAVFRQAAHIKPDMWEAWLEIGNLSVGLGGSAQALAAYDHAIRLKPDSHGAWIGRAAILFPLEHYSEALAACQKALALEPDDRSGKAFLFQVKASICDWSDYTDLARDCVSDVENSRSVIAPFISLSMPASPAQLLRAATNYSKHSYPVDFPAMASSPRSKHQKIKIAYLSNDFRDHATSYLLAGALEHHDHQRFEVIGLSLTSEKDTATGQRVKSAFDVFHNVYAVSDAEIANLIHSLEADIAVDLHGYTHGMRTGIFLRRPAPVQVNYLGFPGTMGAPFMDYIVADKTVIPESDQKFYTEKVAWLPDSYQPNDDKRSFPDLKATRADFGLPPDGFVFCCFNNTFKITPDIFEVWMRLLQQVENSVLWLLEVNATAKANLRKEADARGIAADRLIFAPRVSSADHLARHKLADVFLDTLYYNAHTTASDALWTGLPVITREGQTFASRVASSLLRAVGLPELVTTSLEDYEALALKLARDPALLASIKTKLTTNRLTAPLFDTKRYTRHLEAAYITMYERALRGEKPESFVVAPLP